MTVESNAESALVPVAEPEARLIEYEPSRVLLEAASAATALGDVLAKKPHKFMIRGRQYLEFEDWQTVGRFYGITAALEDEPEYVEIGGARGFRSTAVALHRGQTITRAVAFCLTDEEKWGSRPKYEWHYVLRDGSTQPEDPGSRDLLTWEPNPAKPGKNRPVRKRVHVGDEQPPLFQLASMSQTRALAKALRNVLSWVVVLAGYGSTPAEEVESIAEEVANGEDRPRGPEPEMDDERTYVAEKVGGKSITQKEADALVAAVATAGFPAEPVQGRKGALFPGAFLKPLGLGEAEKLMPLYLFCQNRAIYEATMAALGTWRAPQVAR